MLNSSSEKYCSVKINPVNKFNPNSLVYRVFFSPLSFFKSQLNDIIAPQYSTSTACLIF